MKLKDYEIPQYGLEDGAGPESLGQYSLKNFDLKTFQVTGKLPEPVVPEPVVPDPGEVRFGPHFSLQQPLYIPPSPSQSWKMPRWVVTMVGLFFGSAALLTVAVCVVLLRDPKAPATEPLAAPAVPTAAAVATTSAAATSAAPARPVSPPPLKPAAPATASATASAMHTASPPVRRIVVSLHPSVVRRQLRGARRVASKSSSPAPQELESASSRPPKDALDQLLGESSL